jgi:hypothetical protein
MYLKTKDSVAAATAANRAAAVKATFAGLDGFADLDKKIAGETTNAAS